MRNIVFAGSFDPAHRGHLNTFLKASRILDEKIRICICYNEIKQTNLFSLEERLKIAEATFPTDDISICRTNDEIKKMLIESDLYIRGFRKGEEQIEKGYSLKLLTHYGLEILRERFFFVEIDSKYENYSSSAIKELARKGDVNLISSYVTERSFSIIQAKLGVKILKGEMENDRVL